MSEWVQRSSDSFAISKSHSRQNTIGEDNADSWIEDVPEEYDRLPDICHEDIFLMEIAISSVFSCIHDECNKLIVYIRCFVLTLSFSVSRYVEQNQKIAEPGDSINTN